MWGTDLYLVLLIRPTKYYLFHMILEVHYNS